MNHAKLLLLLTLTACQVQAEALEPIQAPDCPGACAHLKAMGCGLASPAPGGTTCEQLCYGIEHRGGGFVSCTRWAISCDDANSCGEAY